MVTLERQVGNRYFVSAANATKSIYLKEAAVQFLIYTGKDTGNKLEKDVFAKLHNHLRNCSIKSRRSNVRYQNLENLKSQHLT